MKSIMRLIIKVLILLPILMACEKSEGPSTQIVENELNYVLTELASGAALHGANGIDIGPDGNLYVGSVIGLEIVVMDKDTGAIIDRLGQDKGVNGADDLVFGPDGSLYWTDTLIGEVGRMTPEGTVTKQFVAPGVNPIAFSADGRLFVALDFTGDGLYELDPNLIETPRPIIASTEANPYPLGFFNAFDFCADGRLFGPLFAAGLVISVDVDRAGDPVSDPFADGSAQVVATGFRNPASAKFDKEGLLTVLDQTGEVFKIDIQTGEKTLFTTLDTGLDNMVFDKDGTLYMTNNDQGWVAEIMPDGQPRFISPGGIIAPQGLAVLPGENDEDVVFVADQYNLRQLNSGSGEQEKSFQGFLVPPPDVLSLVPPQNVSRDGNNLLISSWFAGAVQIFDPKTGQVLEHFPMAVPIDAVRFKEDIVVTDLGFGGVVWASDQSMILPIDDATVFAPGGLAANSDTVWVADWGTGIVWQIDFEGKTASTPVMAASGFINPEGLALDNEGGLLVVESGAARVSRIDLATGEVTTIMENLILGPPGLEGFPPTWGFDGIDVGSTGVIYLSGAGKNVIHRISKE